MKHVYLLATFALFTNIAFGQERVCNKDSIFKEIFSAYETKVEQYISKIAFEKCKVIEDKTKYDRAYKETLAFYENKIHELKAKSFLHVQQQDCKASDLELKAYVAGFLSSAFHFQIFFEDYEAIGQEFANDMSQEISRILKKQ